MKLLSKIVFSAFFVSICLSCYEQEEVVVSESLLAELNALLRGHTGVVFKPVNATDFKFSFNNDEAREEVLKRIERFFANKLASKEFDKEILTKIDNSGLNSEEAGIVCNETWSHKLLYSEQFDEFYSQICVTITCTGSSGFKEVICYESLDGLSD